MTDDVSRRNRRARRDPRAEPEGASSPDADVIDPAQLPPTPVFTTVEGARRPDSPTLPGTPTALTGPLLAPVGPHRSLTVPAIPSMRGVVQLDLKVGAPPLIVPATPTAHASSEPTRRDTLDERRMREAAPTRTDGATEPPRRPTQARMKTLTVERDTLATQVQELERVHQESLHALEARLAEREAQRAELEAQNAAREARLAELEGQNTAREAKAAELAQRLAAAELLAKRGPDPRVLALVTTTRHLGSELEERTAQLAVFTTGLEAAAVAAQQAMDTLRELRGRAQSASSELGALGQKLEQTVRELHGLTHEQKPSDTREMPMPNRPSVELSMEPGTDLELGAASNDELET